ncbi:MAG: hypothetical protein JO270_27525 [Acidobacteriaceae bacterium]|nr:hypothetical protein [Acidobacteriaceae bacterium]
MNTKPALDFVYFDAGGGHRSAAIALQSVIASMRLPWDVRLMNLQDVLDPLDIFRRLTGVRMQDIYNFVLAKGWTIGSTSLLPPMHGLIRLYLPAQIRILRAAWKERQPDMVVSLIPNFNRALFKSLEIARPGVPLVTILTDMADYPPHFWIERQPQYLICGTEHAAEQAKAAGHDSKHVYRTSGMILRPQFYEQPCVDPFAERERLGLNPNLPTGLVLFGGEGSNAMFSIARCLGNCATDLQLILICGRNANLRRRLRNLRTRNRMLVEGFTKEIPFYMQLSDFFIGKPGPGSISEALKMGLPIIVERNAWTLPQERFNTDWIREQGVGLVLKNFRHIDEVIGELLAGQHLADMKHRIERLENRAVFEIPSILQEILHKTYAGLTPEDAAASEPPAQHTAT